MVRKIKRKFVRRLQFGNGDNVEIFDNFDGVIEVFLVDIILKEDQKLKQKFIRKSKKSNKMKKFVESFDTKLDR